jgi:hypothetical protein
MAEVTNELMYELLTNIQGRLGSVEQGLREVKQELNAVRGVTVSIQSDLHNIYGILARHDERLDRIETRLELRELAEKPQTPYEPPKS